MSIILAVTTAQVTLNYTGVAFASGGGATVLGYEQSGAWNGGTLETLCEDVIQSWDDHLQTSTSENVTLASVRAISTTVGAEVPANLTGVNTADTCPPNTSVLVAYTTAHRGRRGRGRSFLPGLAFESAVSDTGLLSSGALSDFQTAVDGFFDDIYAGGGRNQVVLQNTEGSSAPLLPPPQVTSRSVQGRVATQRRRLRR